MQSLSGGVNRPWILEWPAPGNCVSQEGDGACQSKERESRSRWQAKKAGGRHQERRLARTTHHKVVFSRSLWNKDLDRSIM